jgi:hypothetical protein
VLSIDHVVLAVRDLDASAERLRLEHGLSSIAGGRHTAWGTANRIIPLGADYVELLAVVDPDVAARNRVGRFLQELTADGDRWFTVSLADDELDITAHRLGLDVVNGERERPDGAIVRWRSCGFEDDPERVARLSFFIEWDVPPEAHPGRSAAEHLVAATGIAWIEMGDDGRLRAWLGEEGRDLPIRIIDGDPGIRRVALATADGGELVLDP